MQCFHRPAVVDEFARQPIEQLRVRGRIGLRAEVAARAHQPRAKERSPGTIDGHASDQRIGVADQPAGEFQAILGQRRRCSEAKTAGIAGSTGSRGLKYSPR